MNKDKFTLEAMSALHRMLSEEETKKRRSAQERAATLTKELQAQYGPFRLSVD